MEFNELTVEQKARARACASTEELMALAEAEGVELTDASSVKQRSLLVRL